MAGNAILTIDVGTSSSKAALWDAEGRVLSEALAAYTLHRPEPLWAEIDPEIWWRAICDAIQQLLAESSVCAADIALIAVDAVGWTLIPVDEQLNALAPAMIWLDRRASEEAAWLKQLPVAEHLVNLVANPIDEAYITPKLVWLRRQRPEIFESAYQFLDAAGYIIARLTGQLTCDTTQAYGYHFFDIRNERWDERAAEIVGVPLAKIPRLCPPTEVVGAVMARVETETGLRAGTLVLAGCLDAAAGALGAGVTSPGQTNEQGGQAGGVGISLARVVVEPRLIFSRHVLPDQYLLAAGTVGGGSLGWFRDQFGQPETAEPFELLSQQAAQSPPGANGLIFLPYMAGERTPLWSSVARGVFFGLAYSTQRADVLRAIMEGCAYAVYDNLQIAEGHGAIVSEFLGSGGATQSPVWCQIKADVYDKPFVVAQRADGGEGGHGLGLFALAACAAGFYDDIAGCVDDLLPRRRVYEPSPGNHARYQELFQVYRNVSRKLMADFADLDRIQRTL
ncbi:MAG: xylulokinase [Candidatus Promineifilaceae bacterium]